MGLSPPYIVPLFGVDLAARPCVSLGGRVVFDGHGMDGVIKQHRNLRQIGGTIASDTKNRLKYSFQSVFNAVPALHFRDDKVSIAKICLVPITISQLKYALHILIGDWYEMHIHVHSSTTGG